MKINNVAYAKLFNLGNYENERLELCAMLEPDDDYHLAMEELAGKVQMMGSDRARARGADRDAEYNEYGAKARLERIYADIDAAQARWEKALAFLTAHGLATADLVALGDLPF